MEPSIRLQKFLAQAGIASRRKAEELISAGQVKVNGEVITRLGTTVDPDRDSIEFNGKPVSLESEKVYFAVNKPAGMVSSAGDFRSKSVIDLVKLKVRLFPVGQLDKEATGLIILTNDGDFANQVLHPSFGAEKEYFVMLDKPLEEKDIKKLEKGMVLGGKRVAGLKVAEAKHQSAKLILNEGVNWQIKKMLGRMNYTVRKIKRIRIGKLELAGIAEGKAKKISKSDVL